MVRTFITPQKGDISIHLPESYIGRKVEIIAFTVDEDGEQTSGYEPLIEYLDDNKLTKMAMSISEKSLLEDWADEDNANWERFLKD